VPSQTEKDTWATLPKSRGYVKSNSAQGELLKNYNWKIMEPPILTDKDQFPTEEIICSHIGKTKPLWNSLFDFIHTNNPDISEEWRYYNDGKSWLMKVTRKSNTIFWLSTINGSFRTTFYFTDKAEEAISGSSISSKLKEQFDNAKRFGKIRGITIVFKNKKDVEDAKMLIAIKLSIK